ncbi:hypothetical protein KKH3_02230 [Pectobacterium actinidiae]|nr:hypothetical protein KKH3_02230 [Pectobacterium actinidiae]
MVLIPSYLFTAGTLLPAESGAPMKPSRYAFRIVVFFLTLISLINITMLLTVI